MWKYTVYPSITYPYTETTATDPATFSRLQALAFQVAFQSISDKIFRFYRQLAHNLTLLEPTDPVRLKHEALLLEKLYDMGILGTAGAGGRGKLSEVEKKVTVSSMCRRRLGVVMTRLNMADTLQAVRALSLSPSLSLSLSLLSTSRTAEIPSTSIAIYERLRADRGDHNGV